MLAKIKSITNNSKVMDSLGIIGLGLGLIGTIASDIAGKKSMENTIAEKVAEEVANYMKKED